MISSVYTKLKIEKKIQVIFWSSSTMKPFIFGFLHLSNLQVPVHWSIVISEKITPLKAIFNEKIETVKRNTWKEYWASYNQKESAYHEGGFP